MGTACALTLPEVNHYSNNMDVSDALGPMYLIKAQGSIFQVNTPQSLSAFTNRLVAERLTMSMV